MKEFFSELAVFALSVLAFLLFYPLIQDLVCFLLCSFLRLLAQIL